VESNTFYGGVGIIFSLQLCKIERFLLLPNICTCWLQFAVPHKTGTPLLMSHEWIYLTKTSNWAHEVASVDSSTWKKSLELEMNHFIYHLVFHIFRHIWNAPLNNIVGRDIRLMFALLASPRCCFTVFNKQGVASIFPIVWVFLLGNFKYDFIWCLFSWWKLPAR